MVNDDKTPCCGENIEKIVKEEVSESIGCYEEISEEIQGKNGCGCGCGGEFPDESLVKNPETPKTTVETEFFKDFGLFAHKMGIVSINMLK